jgi:thiamine-phosphate pyrophosphorylase
LWSGVSDFLVRMMTQQQPQSPIDWAVCIITDRTAVGNRALSDVVRAAVAGGATLVQFRDKNTDTRDMVEMGRVLHEITLAAEVPLLVNDRIDVALAIGAEGVHVGQDDMPAPLARQLIGPQRILGVSAENVAQAQQAEQEGADYLGVGAVFATPSKADANAPIGLEGLAEVVRSTTLPVLAIGGVTPDNTPAVMQAGAAGIAVIAAVMSAADPEAAARQLRRLTHR